MSDDRSLAELASEMPAKVYDWDEVDVDLSTQKLLFEPKLEIDRIISSKETGSISLLPWKGVILTDAERRASTEVLAHELGPKFVAESVASVALTDHLEKPKFPIKRAS